MILKIQPIVSLHCLKSKLPLMDYILLDTGLHFGTPYKKHRHSVQNKLNLSFISPEKFRRKYYSKKILTQVFRPLYRFFKMKNPSKTWNYNTNRDNV